jgi:hypothetical protein
MSSSDIFSAGEWQELFEPDRPWGNSSINWLLYKKDPTTVTGTSW